MNELKVGLLTLVAIGSVVIMSLVVTSNQSGFGEYKSYKTIVNDAAGIFPKTPIKIAGINSGRIKEISLSGNQAIIEFEILESVIVTAGSKLKIKSIGFLGDKYLELEVSESKERLEEGALIPNESGAGIEKLTKDASIIMKDLKIIMGNIKESIAPDSGETPIDEIFSNIRQVSIDVKKMAESMSRIVSGNEDKIKETLANIEKITTDMRYQMSALNEDSLMADFKKIGPIMDNAKMLTSDLQIMMADLMAGKGTVGKLLRDEEVIDRVSETLSGVQNIVNRVDAIQTDLSLFTVVNSEDDTRSDFGLTISPSPERFYLLGITTTEIGAEQKLEIKRQIDEGDETIERRTETDLDTYHFNVQIGRRVQNWSFRVGIFESSGGFGVDYNIPRWGTTLTLEVFDYKKELNPNVRLLSHVHLWNVFYGKVGVEDIVSKADEQSYTFGAGLNFSDEDLKGLIGFFF